MWNSIDLTIGFRFQVDCVADDRYLDDLPRYGWIRGLVQRIHLLDIFENFINHGHNCKIGNLLMCVNLLREVFALLFSMESSTIQTYPTEWKIRQGHQVGARNSQCSSLERWFQISWLNCCIMIWPKTVLQLFNNINKTTWVDQQKKFCWHPLKSIVVFKFLLWNWLTIIIMKSMTSSWMSSYD